MLPELQVTHYTAYPIYANNKKLTLKNYMIIMARF